MYAQFWLELNFGYTTPGGGGGQTNVQNKKHTYLSYSAKFTKPLGTRILHGTRGTHCVRFRIDKSALAKMYSFEIKVKRFQSVFKVVMFFASFIH